jgi:vitamin B12 transporter
MQFSNVNRLLTLTAASLVINSSVHAQGREAISKVEEIVITSSRIPRALRRIGTSVSVITTEDIEAHGNLALTDVLRQLPAVSTTSNGGAGKPTSLRIRGEEGYRTLTIVDGLRLSDPSSTQVGPQLEHILSSGIGRVEILRGPQGLGYGADAGGVVNLSSRQVDAGLLLALDAQGGKFGTRQTSANMAGGNTRGDFFLALTDFATDGFNSQTVDSVLKDADGYTNTTLHLGGSINLSDGFSLDLVHRKVDGDSAFDGCYDNTYALVHNCADEYGLQASRVALNFNDAGFSHTVSYATTETERANFSAGVAAFNSAGEINRFEYLGSATALPGFDLVFGADLEEALNNGIGRVNTGVFLEYLSDYSSNLFFTAGVRHDRNDDFGINNSYRLSTAYLINLGGDATLKLKGSYGTGLRAPSPYEISYNTGEFAYPPASLIALRQEQSKGYEVGMEYWNEEALHLEAVYFDQDVVDAIYFDLDAFSGYLQDLGTSTSHGVELSGDYRVSDIWRLTANYTYNPTERPNGQSRLRRPKRLMNLGASYVAMQDRLNLNMFYRISQDSVDESGATLVKQDDFAVLDLSANFALSDAVQIYGRVENLVDEKYQEITGYNTAGRAAYVGFKLNYAGF